MNTYKDILRLGTPVVVGQIGNLVLNFADTFMIGHHSTTELASASFINSIFVLSILFAIGFNIALTPILGPYVGRGEKERVGRVLRSAFWANGLLCIILVVVMVLFYVSLPYLGQPEELIPLMRPYLLVNIAALPFAVFACQMRQFFDTVGRTKLTMYTVILANSLNILGNYLLIYGHWGLPELGLLGAGISTGLSRIVMATVFCGILLLREENAVYVKGMREAAEYELRIFFKRINSLGWLSATQATVEIAAFSLVAIFVGWTGTTPLAAHQVMITISLFFFNFYLGISSAVSIRVSHFVGLCDTQKIREVTRAGLFMCMACACILVLPAYVLRHKLGYLFTTDTEVCRLVATCIVPMMLYQFSDAFQCTFSNALRGLGEMKSMMYASFFAYGLVSMPLSWFLGILCELGLVGIWCTFPVCLTVAGVLYYIIYYKRLIL